MAHQFAQDDWREMGFTHPSASKIFHACVRAIRQGGPIMYYDELAEMQRLHPHRDFALLNRVVWERHHGKKKNDANGNGFSRNLTSDDEGLEEDEDFKSMADSREFLQFSEPVDYAEYEL